MSNIHNIVVKKPEAPPSPSSSGGGLGLNLSSGMEGAVTAALSYLEQILCKINNQELKQYQKIAEVTKDTSKNSAHNIIDGGQEQFVDALAEGIGAMGGSALALGTMGVGEWGLFGKLKDPSKPELSQLQQEKLGVQSYKEALPKTFKASIDETGNLPAENVEMTEEEQAVAAQAKLDRAQEVEERLSALKKKRSFVGADKKAANAATEKTAEADLDTKELQGLKTDRELIQAMDERQAVALNDVLDSHLTKVGEKEQALASKQAARRNTFSTIGQSLTQVSSGTGRAIGAFAKKEQAVDQAAAQLGNSAAQGMQTIMSQLLKTANDALSQAQQTIQTFATISNGNRFQG